jgi:starch phosphorylase
MAREAGEENFFLFGLTAQQVADSRGWYTPQWHIDHEPDTRAAIETTFSDRLSFGDPSVVAPLRDALLTYGDRFMHLADLMPYLQADRQVTDLYARPDDWARTAILNVASSGMFSSDRTISQYASEIWNARPCPVT